MTYLPVKENGIIEMADLENAITPETSLVSIMAVNNEIGSFLFIFEVILDCFFIIDK